MTALKVALKKKGCTKVETPKANAKGRSQCNSNCCP
jgi:hypothetical protein